MLRVGSQVFDADRRLEDYARRESCLTPATFRFVSTLWHLTFSLA